MGIISITGVKLGQVFVHKLATLNSFLKSEHLVGRRQFTIQKQIAHLQVGALLSELINRIPAIQKDPLLSVKIGDGASATGRRDETRVERKHAEFLI